MNQAVTRGLLFIGAAILSLILATFGFWLYFKLHVPMPGELMASFLVSRGHYFSSIAAAILMPIAIDWVSWLLLMCLLYWLFRRTQQRRGKSS